MSTKFSIFLFVFTAFTVSISNGQQQMVRMPFIERCMDPNEEYVTCGIACPIKCSNYLLPPQPCPAICYRGCKCKQGFIRKFDNGPCILPTQCDEQLNTMVNFTNQ